MKVAIISCFDFYEKRVNILKEEFEAEGYDCEIYMSDFCHHKKRYYEENEKWGNVTYVHAKKYKKNLSIGRLISHHKWAKSIYEKMTQVRPDKIYALIPPNSVGKYMAKYKGKYGCELNFDIIDMWPESFTKSDKIKRLLKIPFMIWRNMRNKALDQAKVIYTECAYYQKLLAEQGIRNKNFKTRYLIGPAIREDKNYEPEEGTINLCYLGSINNIIDIPKIVEIAAAINTLKKANVHVIGQGEQKDTFIKALTDRGIENVDHGAVFDEERKQQIMNRCDFAFNIMKDSVAVGVTTKSIDYMWAGVPLINNIKYDTVQLVEKYKIGYNVNANNITEIAKTIAELTTAEKQTLRNNVTKCYLENFCAK